MFPIKLEIKLDINQLMESRRNAKIEKLWMKAAKKCKHIWIIRQRSSHSKCSMCMGVISTLFLMSAIELDDSTIMIGGYDSRVIGLSGSEIHVSLFPHVSRWDEIKRTFLALLQKSGDKNMLTADRIEDIIESRRTLARNSGFESKDIVPGRRDLDELETILNSMRLGRKAEDAITDLGYTMGTAAELIENEKAERKANSAPQRFCG